MNHGDFLIRDSRSNQCNFVLTSNWQKKTLHFLIRKTVLQSSETCTRFQYSLEEEAFESLPALVHFYVGGKAALTQWSGAQIQRPVNRTLPLSYLETAFGTIIGSPSCHSDILCGQQRMRQRRSDHGYLYVFKYSIDPRQQILSQGPSREGPSLGVLILDFVLYSPLLYCPALNSARTLT